MAESQHEEIAKLEELYANNPAGRVFTHLAEAYRKAGQLDRAREIAQNGLRRHDGYASAHVVLGRIFADLGRREDATAEFQRVLQLDPENRIALRELGEYARAQGRPGEALEHFRQLLQFDPGDDELAATVHALEQEAAVPQDADTPAAAPDMFSGYAEPFAGEAPPQEPVYGAPTEPPGEFEPMPLSFDWPAAGGSSGGANAYDWDLGDSPPAEAAAGDDAAQAEETAETVEPDSSAPDLRMDWDLDGGGDVVASAPPVDMPDSADTGEPGLEIGRDFRLDVPDWEIDAPAAAEAVERPETVEPTEPAEPVEAVEDAAEPVEAAEPVDAVEPVDAEPVAAEPVEAAEPAAAEPAAAEPVEAVEMAEGTEPGEWAEYPTFTGPATAFGDPDVPVARSSFIDRFERHDLPHAAETEVYTETLAELYRAQGYPERAAEIYRALLADRPGDERLMQKLREVEGVELEDASHEAELSSWAQLAASREHEVAEPDAGAAVSEVDDERRGDAGEAVAAIESEGPEPDWMEYVESAWTGGQGVAAADPSLFAPPAEETEAEAGGVSIGGWLDDLLSWRPTRRVTAEPEEELLLLDEVVEEAAAPAEPEPRPAAETPLAAPMPWDQQVPAEPPAPPATAESGDAQPHDSEAARDAFDELFGDITAPAESRERGAAGDAAGETDEDDDDLEMFRSWLQSLRR
jgi:tetratricopeptide (TPR) repeat protein